MTVFDIDTLRDARQYLEGALVPRKADGKVVYIERIYNRHDDNSMRDLRAVVRHEDGGDDISLDLGAYDWEASPTMGLVPTTGGLVAYCTMDTARQWKKVLTAGRVWVRGVSPHDALTRPRRALALQMAAFMFNPKYATAPAALRMLAAGERQQVALSPSLYLAKLADRVCIGYKTHLVGTVDDGVVRLHEGAAALRELISDHITVGSTFV